MNSNQITKECVGVTTTIDKRRNKVAVICPNCGTLASGPRSQEWELGTIEFEHFKAAKKIVDDNCGPGRSLGTIRLPLI